MDAKQCAYPRCQNAAQHQCAICEMDYCEEHCINKGGWICWEDWRLRTGSKPALNLPFFMRSELYEAQGRSPNAQAFFILLYLIALGVIAYFVATNLIS